MPALVAAKETCQALDRRSAHNQQCMRAVDDGALFCAQHSAQEGRLVRSYKFFSSEFHACERARVCTDVADIMRSMDFSQLQGWYTHAWRKWLFGYREQVIRIRHHRQYLSGGDEGHAKYLGVLRDQLRELELAMKACDSQAYSLLVDRQHAFWMHEEQVRRKDEEDDVCGPPSGSTNAKTGKTSESHCHPTDQHESDSESSGADADADGDLDELDPYTRKRARLVSRIRCLVTCGPFSAKCRDEQPEGYVPTAAEVLFHAMAEHLLRRIVVHSPELFVRAFSAPADPTTPAASASAPKSLPGRPFLDVASFLEHAPLSVPELEKIAKRVRRDLCTPGLLRRALGETCRDDDAPESVEARRIRVLGGWVYDAAYGQPMPLDAWDLFHHFVSPMLRSETPTERLRAQVRCPGCALGSCRTFDEWALVEKGSVPLGRFKNYAERGRMIGVYALRALGAVPCAERWGSAPEMARMVPKVRSMKAVYSECTMSCSNLCVPSFLSETWNIMD